MLKPMYLVRLRPAVPLPASSSAPRRRRPDRGVSCRADVAAALERLRVPPDRRRPAGRRGVARRLQAGEGQFRPARAVSSSFRRSRRDPTSLRRLFPDSVRLSRRSS